MGAMLATSVCKALVPLRGLRLNAPVRNGHDEANGIQQAAKEQASDIADDNNLLPLPESNKDNPPGPPQLQDQGVSIVRTKWPRASGPILSQSDLPIIYLRRLERSARNAGDAAVVEVCVFNKAPRQRSLFSRNTLAYFGQGSFTYKALEFTPCQLHSICKDSNMHDKCSVRSPTVGIAKWTKSTKCCYRQRFQRLLQVATWDLAVISGDEFCLSKELAEKHAHFRFYWDRANPEIRFLPLGPREEFPLVAPKDISLSDSRGFLFSFMGSVTHVSRAQLLHLAAKVNKFPTFLHIISNWSQEITSPSSGYLPASTYLRVLLNSTFTLCPSGYNPESYRIYEACETGSIPVLVIDDYVRNHTCPDAYAPFLESGAPFVYLDDWSQVVDVLPKLVSKPLALRQMQANVMSWYRHFMESKADEFEAALALRWRTRVPALSA